MQGALFAAALLQADVLGAHRLAGAVVERLLTVLDEVDQAPELVFVLGQEGGVGGELVAGQTRVAAFADLPRGQHAVAVGQHPIGALIELEQVVEIARVDSELARVGGDLVKAQELALVGGGQRLGVVHRHLRREVPEVALDDLQRNAGVEQAGGAGVADAMGAAKVDRAALVVAQIEPADEPAEALLEGAVGVRPRAEAVLGRSDEQVAPSRVVDRRDAAVHPPLLGADDRDDLVSTRIVSGASSILVCW